MDTSETVSCPDLKIIVNRGFQSNTYLLATCLTQECIVIDPGLDHEMIEQVINLCGWHPIAVLCTHGHFDHIGSAEWLQSIYDLPVFLRSSDLKLAKLANFMMAAFKIDKRIKLPDFQLIQTDDSEIQCGGYSFLFHALPGHTPGSVAIAVNDYLFSGDSLYAKKIALSRLPGEDSHLLRRSLFRLFDRLKGNMLVLPGHGGSARLTKILMDNQELSDFLGQMQ